MIRTKFTTVNDKTSIEKLVELERNCGYHYQDCGSVIKTEYCDETDEFIIRMTPSSNLEKLSSRLVDACYYKSRIDEENHSLIIPNALQNSYHQDDMLHMNTHVLGKIDGAVVTSANYGLSNVTIYCFYKISVRLTIKLMKEHGYKLSNEGKYDSNMGLAILEFTEK